MIYKYNCNWDRHESGGVFGRISGSIFGRLFSCLVLTLGMLLTPFLFPDTGAGAFVSTELEAVGQIVIASPADGYTTTGSRISILGTLPFPDLPAYVNGRRLLSTEHGFFTIYEDIAIGTNEFTFINGTEEYTLHIVREKASSGGTSQQKVTPFSEGTYGTVTGTYPMPRASINEQSPGLVPLVTGTQLRLLGECGSFYQIYDGSFVYKSSIKRNSGHIPVNRISSAALSEDKDKGCIVLSFICTLNASYTVRSAGNGSVRVTLFDTSFCPEIDCSGSNIVKSVEITNSADRLQSAICLKLYEGCAVTGYDCSYSDGSMVLSLKHQPVLNNDYSALRRAAASVFDFNEAALKQDLRPLEGVTVLLDPGHGRDDPGAVGAPGVYGPAEKSFNLNIAGYACERLEDLGARVIMMREDDSFLELSERVAVIRDLVPDISVSIHANSLPQESDFTSVNGYLTFYSFDELNNAAESVNRYIYDNLGRYYGFTYTGAQRKSLSLTRLTACPAILLETVFLSCPEDYELMLCTRFQHEFGTVIADAVSNYIYALSEQQK